MQFRRYWDSFIAILFPPLCASCENVLLNQEELLCSYCQYHLPINDHHLFSDNEVMRRIQFKAPIEMGAAFLSFSKSSLIQTMIHKLKYGKAFDIGIYLGRQFGQQLLVSPFFRELDIIIPLPLHHKKRKARGYSQSGCIAQGLAEVLKLDIDTTTLVRLVNSPSQTTMGRMDRYENVEDVFACLDAEALAGKNILLVDDVLTTGATIASAARTLAEKGGRVYIAVLAIA